MTVDKPTIFKLSTSIFFTCQAGKSSRFEQIFRVAVYSPVPHIYSSAPLHRNLLESVADCAYSTNYVITTVWLARLAAVR